MPAIQELNLEPKVNWGKGEGRYQCWETGIKCDLQGMPVVLPSVRSG